MAEPISKHRVDDECVEEKYATDNVIKIETKAKLQLVLQNSHDDKDNPFQYKQGGED